MAERSGNGAAPWLAFIVGGLLVLVLVIGYFVYSGGGVPAPAKSVNVEIKPPPMPNGPKMPDAPLPTPK